MKTREQAAATYINENRKNINDSVFTIARSDLYAHWNDAFLAGCEHADKESRDFYLLVREFMILSADKHAGNLNHWLSLQDKIRKHLAAFTSRELESLPFKD